MILVKNLHFTDPATQDNRIPSYLVQLLSVSLNNDRVCKYLASLQTIASWLRLQSDPVLSVTFGNTIKPSFF